MSIALTIDTRSVAALIESLRGTSARLDLEIPKALLRVAQHVTGEIRAAILALPDKGYRRTGQMARSFREKLLANSGGIYSAKSYSDLSYAAIQDEGGTIKPRSKKFLAVPLNSSIPMGKWPRHWQPLPQLPDYLDPPCFRPRPLPRHPDSRLQQL